MIISKTKEAGDVPTPLEKYTATTSFADVRSLLGPSWIIDGENAERYEELLEKVGAAVQPIDLID